MARMRAELPTARRRPSALHASASAVGACKQVLWEAADNRQWIYAERPEHRFRGLAQDDDSCKWPQGKHAWHLSVARPYTSVVVNACHTWLGNRFTALPKPAGGKLERILEVASSTSQRDQAHSARATVTIVAAFALDAMQG